MTRIPDVIEFALYSKTRVPLSETDFVDLDKEFIKQTDPLFLRAGSTSKDGFSEKWERSLLGEPVEFFRSYPPAYHHDLAQIPTDKIPGEEGLCFGDAHPENFGFLNLTHGTLFRYNDLDDSGYCPVAYDALRFFTAWRDQPGKFLSAVFGCVSKPDKIWTDQGGTT